MQSLLSISKSLQLSKAYLCFLSTKEVFGYLVEAPDHKEQVLPKLVMGLDLGQIHPYFLRVCFTTVPFKNCE